MSKLSRWNIVPFAWNQMTKMKVIIIGTLGWLIIAHPWAYLINNMLHIPFIFSISASQTVFVGVSSLIRGPKRKCKYIKNDYEGLFIMHLHCSSIEPNLIPSLIWYFYFVAFLNHGVIDRFLLDCYIFRTQSPFVQKLPGVSENT